MEIAEVVTDQDGKFKIPAWGPRFLLKGTIRQDEPTLRIFKPGYLPLITDNYDGVPMRAASSSIVFRLQNKDIELTPFKGSLFDYEPELKSLHTSLEIIYRSVDGCYWKKTPRLLLALQALKMNLAEDGAGNTLRFAYQYAGINQPQCGDAKQFFLDFAH
ncbi:MAG: hypothetical protein Q7R66_20995 [Undibacterium sp.]|uniref:hypothetical protein n=1 Tax=Undibacterium sp. TaxID=1914977 RepID=UPI0027157F6E|nr:hypothetical protein [Undibacterium sp.]MDO8654656.1 hypothetical protein [Undibacterium sp.]